MNSLELIKQIKQFGLSENEAKCYLALYERDSLIVSEIADLTGIARPNAYEAMKRLVSKGMCVAIPGQVIKYSVSPPGTFLEQLATGANASLDNELENLEKKKNELLEKKKELQTTTSKVIGELKTLYKDSRGNSDPLDYIEILRNPHQIHRKYLELYRKAEKEVLGFSRPPFAFTNDEQLAEQFQVQLDAAKRGVIQRSIIQMSPADQAKDFLTKLLESATPPDDGVQLDKSKVIDELPIKLLVFDGRICFFALEDPIIEKTSLTMLVTEHRSMAKSFQLLFESFWEKATDFYVIDGQKYSLIDPFPVLRNESKI